MIIIFKTKIGKTETFFIEKIWSGLIAQNIAKNYRDFPNVPEMNSLTGFTIYPPKIHAIVKDPRRQWRSAEPIDFSTAKRPMEKYRFAPQIPVTSTQRVYMTFRPYSGLGFKVAINGRLLESEEVEELVMNEGFDAVEDFEDYFIKQMKDNEFYAKIIHWTNFKYKDTD